MRKVITGEQVAQLYNRDPFALPVWRAPVYQTPAGIILLVKLARLLAWLVRLAVRHPAATGVLAVLALTWINTGWVGLAALVAWVVVVLAAWRFFWPSSFTRWIGSPARGAWRAWWCYRRRWAGVMAISGVAPAIRAGSCCPSWARSPPPGTPTGCQVRLVSGQSAADVAKRAENLAHGFGALLCRVRTARSGRGGAGVRPPRRPGRSSSPPCPSPPTPTSRRCRSAAARTACPGWSGCTAPTCWSRAPPGRGRPRCCGAWSAPCSR